MKRTFGLLLILFCAPLANSALFAQEQAESLARLPVTPQAQAEAPAHLQPQTYTFLDLQRQMEQNNPDLLSLQEEYRRSRLDVQDAWAGLGPTVDLQVSGTYMFNPPVGAMYINVDELLDSITWPSGVKPSSGQYVKIYDGMEPTLYNFQLSITQPVFTWGKLENAIILYDKIADIKHSQLEAKQQQMLTELKTRLVTLWYLNRIKEIIEEESQYSRRLVEVTEEAARTGLLTEQEALDAKIQAKELDIAIQDLMEQLNNQILELRRATGLEDLTFEQIAFEFDENQFDSLIASNRDEIREKALSEERNSIKMVKDLLDVNKRAEKIAKGAVNWKPDVALQASVGYGGSRFPFAETNWMRKDDYTVNLSIGLKTTIWDGGKKVRDVSRKISETKSAAINQQDVKGEIQKTLNSNWNTIDVCNMKIDYQNLKISSAQSKIQQNEIVFNTGYGSESDLLSAKIDSCNQQIEKQKLLLSRAVSCLTILYLSE